MIRPRLAPPEPRRTRLADYRKAAKLADIRPMPWQLLSARYMTASWRGRWRYPEIAIVVARQNGKTTLLLPRIVGGLLRGERIMHTAQNRVLPRQLFEQVAAIMDVKFRPLLAGRPRVANGQEEIRTLAGGTYRIVAPTSNGARGPTNDLVIVDEARELDDFDFVGAARPTLTASRSPQMLYLSNAGHAESVVLNALRARADADPDLAYLEWSAAPGRAADDRDGWAEANPGLGVTVQPDFLERAHRNAVAEGTLAIFETEHLCRWVTTEAPRLVSDVAWQRAKTVLAAATAPSLGICLDGPSGRAAAVLAWEQADGSIGLTLAADVRGDPLDVAGLGAQLAARMRALRVRNVGYDPATDRDLARYLVDAKPIAGQEFAAASDRFARTIEAGRLRHDQAETVGADLAFAARRTTADGSAWSAVRAVEDRPITAVLAAIRAVWLATEPVAKPYIY